VIPGMELPLVSFHGLGKCSPTRKVMQKAMRATSSRDPGRVRSSVDTIGEGDDKAWKLQGIIREPLLGSKGGNIQSLPV